MADCCQQNYRSNSFDLMYVINQMRDNNFDTEITKVKDNKYDQIRDIEEEIMYSREIGGYRKPTIYSANIEPEEEKKFGTNILQQEYGRPKREAGRFLRMLRSQKVTGIKRNLVPMAERAKRPRLVRMEKIPSLRGKDKRSGLGRMFKRPILVQMLNRPEKVSGIKRNQILRMM